MRAASNEPIMGGEILDQEEVRPTQPVRSLEEFLEFLAEIEDLFGPIEKPAGGIRGDRFLL